MIKSTFLAISIFINGMLFSQTNINGPFAFEANGGEFQAMFQGAQGDFELNGFQVAHFTGELTGFTFDIYYDSTLNSSYASDLTFLITDGPNINNGIIQYGGYSDYAPIKFPLPCAPACDVADTMDISGVIVFDQAINFDTTDYVVWMGNGYANANAYGRWQINQLVLDGNNQMLTLEENDMSFKISPNPSNDVITINSNIEVNEIILYSSLGNEIYKKSLNGFSTTINIEDFKSGIYFCEIIGSNGLKQKQKFIKL